MSEEFAFVLTIYSVMFSFVLGSLLVIMTPFLLIRFILNIDHPKKKIYQIASALLAYPLFLFACSSYDTWFQIPTSILMSAIEPDMTLLFELYSLYVTYSISTLFLGVLLLAIRKILIPNKTKDSEHLE
ncbi:MAG: hypothetical protein HFP77_00280 [Methylococcales symbiont of Iophon sp. n. MRB-2018]|nr:MAG: hypothetical protein HFP77_00280 [Methylococcales symbiont of Iophon sp. n. MRB-2018]